MSTKIPQRTTVTINSKMAEMLKKATVEATARSGTPVKQADLINFLITHMLESAIEGVIKEKS
ncbi:hypothetical protein ACRFV7_005778 [Klebsiella oxytoca]|uniref:hypothetical protein n=1 Tax=Salmonella sp. CQ22WZ0326SAL TaxID=3417689 RepID=UPI000A268E62|nr:hypothetical protein [Klebsiella pneumoniae]EKW0786046.1 hypothetical protein [Klebsiella michiganensis]HBT3726605.1 hypothetical protein [Klebsiella pneumoniae]HCI3133189.1 hypothetical protein [Klebsiella pneumoniae]HEL3136547.1 hypothetical protein [Klebsiella pneumoniae]